MENDVRIEAGGIGLAGTLTRPRGRERPPVALFLHGSGPLDRNENMPAQGLNVFNALAAGLAEAGIASLRYDKRGCGASGGDYYTAGLEDLVADAGAALAWLRADGGFGPAFLVGHSEGTLIAALLSLRQPVEGLVLLAPFVMPMQEIMEAQAAHAEAMLRAAPGLGGMAGRLAARLLGGPRVWQERAIRRIRGTDAPVIRVLFQKIPARQLRDLLDMDAAAVYARVETPMLLLGGEKDLQCDPADVARIAGIAPGPATQLVLDDLTHMLRRDSQPASLGAYRRLLKEPVDPDIARLVAGWIAARAGERSAMTL